MSVVSLAKIPQGTETPHKQAIAQSLKLIDYQFDENIKKIVHIFPTRIISVAKSFLHRKRLRPEIV